MLYCRHVLGGGMPKCKHYSFVSGVESWALCPPRCSLSRENLPGFNLWRPAHHHRCVLQHGLWGPQKTFVTAEQQGREMGRWENGTCVLSREMTQHPSQDGSLCHPSSYRSCTYQLMRGDFCSSLGAGHLAVPVEFRAVFLVLLGVERKPSSGAGGCCGVSKGLVQLLWSAFSSEGQKVFFFVIAGDCITLITTIPSSNTGETL